MDRDRRRARLRAAAGPRRPRPRTGRGPGGRPASFERLWLVATLALLAVYAGQETLEGLLSSGHPGGLQALLGDGGWWVLPAAALVGAGVAAWTRGAHRIVATAARLGRPPRPLVRRAGVRFAVPRPVLLPAAAPLASAAAGRAPPSR